ncbi:hypothetical protein BRC90_09150 [Halobacteriales archaeon QS_4_69_34]|nr:MAG: hypothetical protein BRC90_09150 [Halobacteriales archaeon QS_4_69_34]
MTPSNSRPSPSPESDRTRTGRRAAAGRNGPGGADAPPTTVPAGETPAARCPHCARPFRTERLCALHLGERHRAALTDGERAAHDDARDAEGDELFVFHLKVVGAITALYAGMVLAYMIVLGVQG